MSSTDGIVRYSNRQLQRARELLARMEAAIRAARFYPVAHPLAEETLAALLDVIRSFHREEIDVHLTFYDGEVMLGEQLMLQESVSFDGLIRDISRNGGRSISFTRGITPSEVQSFVRIAALSEADQAAGGGLRALLAEAGVEHVVVTPVSAVGERVEEVSAGDAYCEAVSLLHDIGRAGASQVDARRASRAARSLVDNVLADRTAMLRLTGLHDYDQYTFYHSANVAVLSVAIGSMISRDHRFLNVVGTAGLLHDIGKLALPSEILNKPGQLTPEEWRDMRAHPLLGAQIVASMPGIDKAVVVAVLEHHMRFDGTGYPQPVVQRPQHLASRIIAVADSYDAMTSRRSYSAARMHEHALSILDSASGTSFDPAVVALLGMLLGVYPPRSVVRLTDERLGIVLAPDSRDVELPHVRVVTEPDGTLLDEPVDVALVEAGGIRVAETLDPRLLDIEVDDYV